MSTTRPTPGPTLIAFGDARLLLAAYRSLERVLPAGPSSLDPARPLHAPESDRERGWLDACRDDTDDVYRMNRPGLEKALRTAIIALTGPDASWLVPARRATSASHPRSMCRNRFGDGAAGSRLDR